MNTHVNLGYTNGLQERRRMTETVLLLSRRPGVEDWSLRQEFKPDTTSVSAEIAEARSLNEAEKAQNGWVAVEPLTEFKIVRGTWPRR